MKFKVGQKVKIKKQIRQKLKSHVSNEEFIGIINDETFNIKSVDSRGCICLICEKNHNKQYICESKTISYIRLTECEIYEILEKKINKLLKI